MNDVKIFGNISQPPEHGQTNNGTAYCNFSVGCREIEKKKNYNEKSTFVDCVVYGASAEFMKNAGEGDEILIAKGSIQVQTWKDKDNKWQKKFRILVDKFIIPKNTNKSEESDGHEQDIPIYDDAKENESTFNVFGD